MLVEMKEKNEVLKEKNKEREKIKKDVPDKGRFIFIQAGLFSKGGCG